MGADSTNSEVGEPEPMTTGSRETTHVVGGAHAFILRISRFFGLAPLRFEARGNGFAVSLSNGICVYSYILITVLVITAIAGLAAEISAGVALSVRMTSTIGQVVSGCDILIVVIVAGAGVYGAPKRMRNMIELLDSVASKLGLGPVCLPLHIPYLVFGFYGMTVLGRVLVVDSAIGGQYSAVRERKLCAILLAILIFFTVLILDDMCFYALQAKKLNRQWSVVINYTGFYLLWYVVMILELQFAFTALSIRSRFQAVNGAIALTAENLSLPVENSKNPEKLNIYAIHVGPADPQRANVSLLMESAPERNVVIIRKSVNGEPRLVVSPSDAIYHLSALHNALCHVVHQIDANYGIPLVVILISTLLHLIVTPYFFIMEIIISSHRPHFLVLQFLWCITHMLRLLIVVEPCHYTIAESKRTEALICKLMIRSPTSGALPSRIEVFYRQLMLQSVCYTPFGMCTLDRRLVASILGAVTTYLVILIQFQRYEYDS